MPEYTFHGRERMAERGITEEDIELALRRRLGPPQPGNRPNTVVLEGPATGGRILKVVVSAADQSVVVTAFWRS